MNKLDRAAKKINNLMGQMWRMSAGASMVTRAGWKFHYKEEVESMKDAALKQETENMQFWSDRSKDKPRSPFHYQLKVCMDEAAKRAAKHPA